MRSAEFLLDSNIFVYLLEGKSTALLQRVSEAVPGELVTSAVVLAEVGMGIDRSDEGSTVAFAKIFERVPALPFDDRAAAAYWRLPFRRAKFDRLIAAHALALQLPLVTANPRDFADVPGLAVEDWIR